MNDQSGLSLWDWHQRYSQQAIWSKDIRQHLFGQIPLAEKDKILEVGSGTGAVLALVAAETHAQTYGIDIDVASLAFASKLNNTIDMTAGDAYKLPFADGTFKICYCHYLLLWIKNPEEILLEMARVTRPGGSVIALAEPDYEARIDYPPPLTLLGAFQRSALDEQGVDIAMGRKLPGLFHKVGLKSVTTGILGAQWSQAVDSTEWIMIQADLEVQFSKAELMNFHKIENDARQRGDRVLFIPTFYAAGVVTG